MLGVTMKKQGNHKDPHGQVEIIFLPPNCSSVHQPLDMGIIASLKVRYKHTLLERTIELLPYREFLKEKLKTGSQVLEESKKEVVLMYSMQLNLFFEYGACVYKNDR